MKDREILSEQIGILKNEMTHLWGSTFVLGGGSLTMLFGKSLAGLILGWIGVFFTIFLFKTYFSKGLKCWVF